MIPLICRRGHVTKQEIGAIRIFDRDTRFEIAPPRRRRFAAAVRRDEDGSVRNRAVPGRGDRPRRRAGRGEGKGGIRGRRPPHSGGREQR
ncbi:MAG: DbpA RNA binding domain-containing protein [Geminicoccaceae bacterium]